MEHIRQVHADNYGVYGVRKMWHALRPDGIGIGREQTARLMRLAGVSGKRQKADHLSQPVSLTCLICARTWSSVNSQAQGPNKLWVADITYVHTRDRFVYAAFVTDVYSRRIVGWALSDSMRTSGVAIASAQPGDCVC